MELEQWRRLEALLRWTWASTHSIRGEWLRSRAVSDWTRDLGESLPRLPSEGDPMRDPWGYRALGAAALWVLATQMVEMAVREFSAVVARCCKSSKVQGTFAKQRIQCRTTSQLRLFEYRTRDQMLLPIASLSADSIGMQQKRSWYTGRHGSALPPTTTR